MTDDEQQRGETHPGDSHFHPDSAFVHHFLCSRLLIGELPITPGGRASVQMELPSLDGALRKTNEDNLSLDTHRPNSQSGGGQLIRQFAQAAQQGSIEQISGTSQNVKSEGWSRGGGQVGRELMRGVQGEQQPASEDL